MKKLFLSSSFKNVCEFLPDFIGTPLTNKKVTFIPTAAKHEKVNFYVKSGKKALEKLGLIVEELDISTASQEEIKRKLSENEFIYMTGGNTFFLLQELRKTGADRLLLEQVSAGKPYIGESAGSIIMSCDITYVKEMDACEEAPELTDFKAMNVVDFYPLPHHTNFPFKKTVEKIIATYESSLSLVPMSNAQVILVTDSSYEVKTK